MPIRPDAVLVHLAGEELHALPSGALWWPARRMLVVSDMHLGKSERIARKGGAFLPPYETRDTLHRLDAEMDLMRPEIVLSLGDAFDDDDAARNLDGDEIMALARMMAPRRWVWVTGNHDPAPLPYGGEQAEEVVAGPITFRHIAEPGASAEISGHYHPKAGIGVRGGRITRPCFLADQKRIVMPAFGTYTGGLAATAQPLQQLMSRRAVAVLTGERAVALPMPRAARDAAGARGAG